jgi:hypothetical protein
MIQEIMESQIHEFNGIILAICAKEGIKKKIRLQNQNKNQ